MGKRITISSLELTNFQGGTFKLDTNGGNLDIYAANGLGKTRLASAFQWLLFNKDSLGRSDFDIKNINTKGETAHGLDHSVEGVFDVDGKKIILSKTYRETWTKKRGASKATFTGHTTDYGVNGVPVQKKEYQGHVEDIAGDEDIFKLLTSPSAFPTLHWKKQRELLMEVCGDISDHDVLEEMVTPFDNKDDISNLTNILNDKSLDDHRAIITARRTVINKELEKIPVRIDEVNRALPDITGLDKDKIVGEVAVLESKINDQKLQLQGIDTGGNIAELSKNLAIVNADMQSMETTHYSKTMKLANELNVEIEEHQNATDSRKRRIASIDVEIDGSIKDIKSLEGELDELRATWSTVDSITFKDTIKDTIELVCPACNQDLPNDKVREAREKALGIFNNDKAVRLANITKNGESLNKNKGAKCDCVSELEAEKVSLQEVADTDILSMLSNRDKLKEEAKDYSGIRGYQALHDKKVDIEIDIKAEREGQKVNVDEIENSINADIVTLTDIQNKLSFFARRESGAKRIDELMAQEKELAAEFEKLEHELYLSDEFIRTKVTLLTDRINSQFKVARFKLFDQLVNGGLEECCEITVDGIPYDSGLNNAARINAGLDVCRTLADHYGLHAPVFVDNAESVCDLLYMDTQVIRLIVSKIDLKMRVEKTEEVTV